MTLWAFSKKADLLPMSGKQDHPQQFLVNITLLQLMKLLFLHLKNDKTYRSFSLAIAMEKEHFKMVKNDPSEGMIGQNNNR